MKVKHALAVLGVMFGFALLLNLSGNSKPTPIPEPGKPQPPAITEEPASEGTVAVADEPAGGQPYQVSVADPSNFLGKVAVDKQPPKSKFFTYKNKTYPLLEYKTMAIPNDPNANQWWVGNSNLDDAWDIPRGANETVLAIIDTGFALGHEEFAGRWYQHPGETGAAASENPSSLNCTDRTLALSASCNLIDDDFDGVIDNETGAAAYENPSRLNCTAQSRPLTKDCNRTDDDGNGLVDDTSGWDFINNDNSPQAGELNSNGDGTDHGTLVAGIAAATGGNGTGIAGADWGTKILPIQAMDDDGYGDTLSVGRSILYAVDRGADVISISLGTAASDQFVLETIEEAIEAGVTVVAAAGNDGCDCMVYPARYPEVIGVGALDTSNSYAGFSSYGTSLDILAPGTSMTSPTFTAANQTSAYASGINGTSFATPLTAGLLTTLLSHQPAAKPLQLIAALTESTNRLALPSSPSHNPRYGFGKIDALASVQRMTGPRTAEQTYVFGPVSQGAYLSPSQPAEDVGNFYAHHCSDGIIASTPVYELTKPAERFFSISRVEIRKAQAAGFSATFLTYACVQQPHDNPGVGRTINLHQEMRNIFYKL